MLKIHHISTQVQITFVEREQEDRDRAETQREMLTRAEAGFASDHPVTVVMERDKAEKVIPGVVAATEHSLLLMGAYGHSPIRRMIVGSTTTEMVRTVKAPVLMVR